LEGKNMKNSEHQAVYRARQRAKGQHETTLWLTESNYARLTQICQSHALPRELVVNHALAWALLSQNRLPDSYWDNLRQSLESQKREAGNNGSAFAVRGGGNGSGTIPRSSMDGGNSG
jgi:hypothetical protein